ncbi:MAG: AMP-binding protein [Pseudoxanthomonas sp.]
MKVNFSNLFQAVVDKYGDREAILNIERNRRLTFREHHLLTNRIVNAMTGPLGLGVGDAYLNILKNDSLTLLHFGTALKGPAIAAYANYRDTIEEHAWKVENIRPKIVFIENELLDACYQPMHALGATLVCMDPLDAPREGVYSLADLITQVGDENPSVVLDDREHVFMIRFTGGTTSNAKPAIYSPDNWVSCYESMLMLTDMEWGPHSRALHMAPISHGSGVLVLPAYFSGGCNVTMNDPDLVKFCQLIEQEKITNTMAVPTMLYRLLAMPEVARFDLSSLRGVFYGTMPISPDKLKQVQSRFGNVFVQGYGATENSQLALSLHRADHVIDNPEQAKHLAAAGRVQPGVELLIMDDDGKPVPRGQPGEIWMRSRGTIRGYYDRPEATASEFTEDGFWKSGDIGRMDENGYVYIVDRKKDMIISGGFNVYAAEVEAVINSHDAIMMSVVIGMPHEDWGEAIHAEVVLMPGVKLEEKELLAYLRARLGGYKVPKSISIVDALPLSPAGKVLRRVVRDRYRNS